jgi:hypothetical protein
VDPSKVESMVKLEETEECAQDSKFLSSRWILPDVCRSFLQVGSTLDEVDEEEREVLVD